MIDPVTIQAWADELEKISRRPMIRSTQGMGTVRGAPRGARMAFSKFKVKDLARTARWHRRTPYRTGAKQVPSEAAGPGLHLPSKSRGNLNWAPA